MNAKGQGRKKTPTAKLKLAGGYREDRHGSRRNEPQPKGEPVRPGDLSPAGRKMWDDIVPQLVETGVAKRSDTAALVSMCEAWSVYRDVWRWYRKGGIQERIDLIPRLNRTLDAWIKLAAKFGLSPSDRAGLQVDEPTTKSDFEDMLA